MSAAACCCVLSIRGQKPTELPHEAAWASVAGWVKATLTFWK